MPPPPNENYASLLDSIRGHRCETMQRRKSKKSDSAVSPVVGVMLMLVVTIVIAAIVAGFAGGLISTVESSPTLSLDTEATTSDLTMEVLSVSEAIDTSNLKIIVSTAKGGSLYEGTLDTITGTGTGITYTSGGNGEDWGTYELLAGTKMNAENFVASLYSTNTSDQTVYNLSETIVAGSGNAAFDAGIEAVAVENTTTGNYDSEYISASSSISPFTDMPNAAGNMIYSWVKVRSSDAANGKLVLTNDGWTALRGANTLTQTPSATLAKGDTIKVSIIYLPTTTAIYTKELVVS